MKISNCCSARGIGETDLCSYCKEHCEFIDDSILTREDLIIDGKYEVTEELMISGHDGDATVYFPKGYILKYKGHKGNFHRLETRDGIVIELWEISTDMLESLEEVKGVKGV